MVTVYCSLSVCLEIVPRCGLASLVVNMKDKDPNLHRKNSPLIWIDGDAVQLQRMEYGRCQTDVELQGVRLAVSEHEYLLNGSFTVSVFSCLH